MAEFGIKVAQPGFDVRSAAERNLSLYTKYPIDKIAFDEDAELQVYELDIFASMTIEHNLGYKPRVLAYIQNDVGSSGRHLVKGYDPFAFPAGDGFHARFMLIIDDNDFTIAVEFPGNVPDDRIYKFHYYIMYDDVGL